MVEGRLVPYSAAVDWVTVDGMDSTSVIADILNRLISRVKHIDYVLTDTMIYAGLNILDPYELSRSTGLPVVVVFMYPLGLTELERALRHVPYYELRLHIARKVLAGIKEVPCPKGRVHVSPVNLNYTEAWNICCRLQVYSRIPEPLHAAGVIASSFVKSPRLGMP